MQNEKRLLPNVASFLVSEDCNLACTYCLTGDTLVTMADFSKRPIKDIEKGDMILGFDEYAKEGKGNHRLIRPSEVQQLFHRKADVIRIKLENGNELHITKNHKILNNRGSSEFSWKDAGKYKIGQPVRVLPEVNPEYANIDSDNYKIGYFISMLLGDGNIGHYKDKNDFDAFRVRIAVKDLEIIERMEEYFKFFDIKYNVGEYPISKKENLRTKYLYASSKESYTKVLELIDDNFRKNKDKDYKRGFLAGIYDAEGHISKHNIIRICNSDQEIINEITESLEFMNFKYTIEIKKEKVNKQCYNVRILNPRGSYESLRFILNIDSTVARKGIKTFYEKSALSSSRISEIEILKGEVEVYNIGTDTRTYIANNVAVHNCFELEGRENCNKHMTKEVARKGVEYLCENAIANGDNYFSAMLFGGEPLLKPDIVEEILRHGVELAKKNNMQFTASMITNATILTDKIKYIVSKYMYSAQLNIQLSVDGIKEVHDAYRVTKDGKGSFDMIAKNIDEWKELFNDNIHALSVHGCSNKKSLPFLFENYKFFREEWDIPRLWFLPIHNEEWEAEDVDVYEEQLTKIMDYTLECAKREGNYQEVLNYAPLDRCMSPDIRPSAPCGAGKNFVSITAEGEIYPCHSFYYNDPEKTTKIGDVWEGIDEPSREMFVKYGNEDMSCSKECPDCDAYQCYRCIADNWAANGSIFSQIRGYRCDMSFVERKLQLKTREELIKMGLLNKESGNSAIGNNPDNPDCLCDVRTNDNGTGAGNKNAANGHVRGHDGDCSCKEEGETMALALKVIIDKIEGLEEGQNLIIRRLLK